MRLNAIPARLTSKSGRRPTRAAISHAVSSANAAIPQILALCNQEIRLNDAAYGGKQRGRSEEMWRFPEINFAKVAESFGCVGMRVEQPGELKAAVKKAIALNKPVVIDAVSDLYAIAEKPWTPSGKPDFHSFQKASG